MRPRGQWVADGAVLIFPGAGLTAGAYRAALRGIDQSASPPVLLAHSMGAFAAVEHLRRHPDNVAGLVLCDPSVELTATAVSIPADEPPILAVAATTATSFTPWAWASRLRADLADYPRWAARRATAAHHWPLPARPITVLSAAWSGATPWDRRWLSHQQRLVEDLRAEHPWGTAGVHHQQIIPCGHNMMWWRPAAIRAAVHEIRERC
ncbi:hypothetical protein KEM60_00265 [Austwickia sp. TVS 96-490-7B]|nr:hypothetical protein [Austwickia sp. TVS 96-490-7B]